MNEWHGYPSMANRRSDRQRVPNVTEGTGSPRSVDASWPWPCLRCDASVYHDVLYCRRCRPAAARAGQAGRRGAAGPFSAWIREQSYPQFVGAVTSIASIELALTALWLQVMLVGPANLPLLSAF